MTAAGDQEGLLEPMTCSRPLPQLHCSRPIPQLSLWPRLGGAGTCAGASGDKGVEGQPKGFGPLKGGRGVQGQPWRPGPDPEVSGGPGALLSTGPCLSLGAEGGQEVVDWTAPPIAAGEPEGPLGPLECSRPLPHLHCSRPLPQLSVWSGSLSGGCRIQGCRGVWPVKGGARGDGPSVGKRVWRVQRARLVPRWEGRGCRKERRRLAWICLER